MNRSRLRLSLLAPLFAVLALLLGLAGSASAAFNAAATDPHYGNFLLHTEAPARMPLAIADSSREIGVWLYDNTLGVPVYVRQNPWTKFDPLGLQSEPIPREDPVTGQYLPVPTNHGTYYPVNSGETRLGDGNERNFVHATTMGTNGDNSLPASFSPAVHATDKQVAMNESAREIVFNNFVETVAKPTGAFALENAPFTGTGTAIGEVARGKDLMGADVSRGLAAAGIAAGVVPGGKFLLRKIGKFFKKAAKGGIPRNAAVFEIETQGGMLTRDGRILQSGAVKSRTDFLDQTPIRRVDFDHTHGNLGVPHVNDLHVNPNNPTLINTGKPRVPEPGEYLSPVLSDPRIQGGVFRP